MLCHIYCREKRKTDNQYNAKKLIELEVKDGVDKFLTMPFVTCQSAPDYFGRTRNITLKIVQRTVLFGDEMLIVGEKYNGAIPSI